jgi:hypothetical protein
MDDSPDRVTEALERLAPVLEQVFAVYGVRAERRREITEEARRILLLKWPQIRRPEVWLLEWIFERCREEEAGFDEASD